MGLDVQAQAKPSGTLLNVSAIKSDDQMVCSVYGIGRKKLVWLSRIDGKPALSKTFWTLKTVQKQLQLLARNTSGVTSKSLSAKKVKITSSTLKKYKSALKQCALHSQNENENSGIHFSHVKGVLDKNCMSCHVSRNVTNTEEWYRAAGYIVPGNLEASPLYVALKNNPEKFLPANMPYNGASLSDLHIMMLHRWIRDLAPSGPLQHEAPAPPTGSDLEQGRTLYATNCAQCHGALESSTKRGKTVQQILAAMGPSGILVMRQLGISDDDVRKIALALNNTAVPTTRFEKALSVLQQHCFGCHAGGTYRWETFTTEQQWVSANLVTPRDMRASHLTLRMKYGTQDNPISSEDMPNPKNSAIWNNFSAQDYQTIRDWVVNMDPVVPPNDPEVQPTDGNIFRGSTDEIRLGDRLYVRSVLLDIFGSNGTTILDDAIMERLGIFGGPCDPKDIHQTYFLDSDGETRAVNHINDCENVDIEDPRASLMPPSSALRAGMIEKACLSLSFKSSALQYAVVGAGGSGATSRWPTTTDVEKVYQRFYPGRVPPTSVRDSLVNVVSGAQAHFPSTPIEGWRYLFIATCNGGEWQQP